MKTFLPELFAGFGVETTGDAAVVHHQQTARMVERRWHIRDTGANIPGEVRFGYIPFAIRSNGDELLLRKSSRRKDRCVTVGQGVAGDFCWPIARPEELARLRVIAGCLSEPRLQELNSSVDDRKRRGAVIAILADDLAVGAPDDLAGASIQSGNRRLKPRRGKTITFNTM